MCMGVQHNKYIDKYRGRVVVPSNGISEDLF